MALLITLSATNHLLMKSLFLLLEERFDLVKISHLLFSLQQYKVFMFFLFFSDANVSASEINVVFLLIYFVGTTHVH